MVYEKTFPKCPYRSKGNKKCSHKGCGKNCIYVKCPEKCELYQEWMELKELDDYNNKMDSTLVEMRERAI